MGYQTGALVLSLGLHLSLAGAAVMLGPAVPKTGRLITVELASGLSASPGSRSAGRPAAVKPRFRGRAAIRAVPPERTAETAPEAAAAPGAIAQSPADGHPTEEAGGSNCGFGGPAGGYLARNFARIRDRVQSRLSYPLLARKLGWRGEVVVEFVVLGNGETMDLRIVRSSGHDVLDRNVMDAVKAAQPFPRPPEAARLILPVRYSLSQ